MEEVLTFYKFNPLGIVEIIGPTASGKTSLSVSLALALQKELGKIVEVISVDSRQIYKECDISSAKIRSDEMKGIIHHGIDLVTLDTEYSVYDWQKYAFAKIKEIQDRGHLVMMCGGTMMWLDAVSENYDFDEKGTKSNRTKQSEWEFLKIGLKWPRSVLYERINERAQWQFQNGLIEETKYLLNKYDKPFSLIETSSLKTEDRKRITKNAFMSFGYKEISKYLEGVTTYDEALALNQQRNRNYAKKQLTWWRGREDVQWIEGDSLS